MNSLETLAEELRNYYSIPLDANIDISEEEVSGGGCCHDYPYTQTFINYEYVPQGKKRKVKRFVVYSGTV